MSKEIKSATFPFSMVTVIACGDADAISERSEKYNDLRELLQFMAGRDLPTEIDVKAACTACGPLVLEQYPQLVALAEIYKTAKQRFDEGGSGGFLSPGSLYTAQLEEIFAMVSDLLEKRLGSEIEIRQPDPSPQFALAEVKAEVTTVRIISDASAVNELLDHLVSEGLDRATVDDFRKKLFTTFEQGQATEFLERVLNVLQYQAVQNAGTSITNLFRNMHQLWIYINAAHKDPKPSLDVGMFNIFVKDLESQLPAGVVRGGASVELKH